MTSLAWNDRAERLWLLEHFIVALRFHGFEQRAEACEAEYRRLRAELLQEAA